MLYMLNPTGIVNNNLCVICCLYTNRWDNERTLHSEFFNYLPKLTRCYTSLEIDSQKIKICLKLYYSISLRAKAILYLSSI